jgi:hypothetical protein
MIRVSLSAVLIALLAGAVPASAASSTSGDRGASSARSPLLLVAAGGAFDGSYVGTVTNVKQASTCGSMNSWHGTFSVVSNQFTTNIGRYRLTGDVHPDGSFETSVDMGLGGRQAVIHFSGNIAGNTLHATGRTPLCLWDMDMRK